MRYLTMTWKTELSLVLLAVDDFTDRVITGSQICMRAEPGGKRAIRKEDGFHVFCGLGDESVNICVEGPLYQRQQIRLQPDGGREVVRVRMAPGPAYPIPGGTTCVRGRALPGSSIFLYFPDQKRCCKLLQDYDPARQRDRMGLYRPAGMSTEGRRMCICDRDGNSEIFRILDREDEECRLERPLTGAYRKIGTSVYPVCETEADADGGFYLLVRGLTGEQCAAVLKLSCPQAGTREMQLALKPGKENCLDLRPETEQAKEER